MRKLVHILFVFVAMLAPFYPAFGTAPPTYAGQLCDPADMEAFFDDYLGTQMVDNHVAGAVVSVVKDDQVLFSKGYGYADVVKNIAVDPDRTVFILGSLSKLFTWTAVMQLVDQGKLDLDADVNTYLDFKIPDTYPQPITLNHLMAHNAGFEDSKFDQMAPTTDEMTPLGEWLESHIPARIYPPGQFSAYENYGATLAGYIVTRVSGMSYDDYVEKNILTPLGMTHTTSRQPIPAALELDMSQSYIFADGAYQPRPGFNVAANVAPAGSFRATAGDVARFMIAHLNNGRYGEASILQPATAQLMHRRSFSHDPQVNGMAHGFWEMDMNGQHIIGHAGSHFIFGSYLMLFPEHNLGVFIAVNSRGGHAFVGEGYLQFEQAFLDNFFPQDLPELTPPADFAQHGGRFSGNYHLTMGRSETTPEKLSAMIMGIAVQADKDGLRVPMLDNARFVQVDPLTFRQVDDNTQLVFKEDSSGNVTQAFLGSNPQTALIKNRWFETPVFNLTLLGLCIVLFLSFEIAGGVALFVRRKRAIPQPVTGLERTAQFVAGLVSILSLLILGSACASIFNMYGLYIGHLPLWTFIPVLSSIVALLTLGMIIFTALAWTRRFWDLGGRIHYTLVSLGAIGFVWFIYFWNILGKSF